MIRFQLEKMGYNTIFQGTNKGQKNKTTKYIFICKLSVRFRIGKVKYVECLKSLILLTNITVM
jgi:hypothetical protein